MRRQAIAKPPAARRARATPRARATAPRPAAPREISGRRARRRAPAAEAAARKARAAAPWIADSHRAINPLIDEITPPIGERQKAGDAHDAERRRPRPRHARLALPPPWIADSHRAIDPLIDEIAPPIGERQIEPQQRMPLRDIEQRGQRPTPPERYGQAHAQRAARLLATVCDHASCSTRSTAATAACAPPYRLAPCST
ncbi:hypothetical protein BMMON2_03820 [Burkholderia mallei]|uniref:hypothetical protein n=1 Tax=Burkholderia pseudomallei TaxID=28450 RepID=UPI0012AEC517|nr:hypothetical protein [Burkholderia pseudomallei]